MKQEASLSHFAIRLAQVGMKKAAEDGNLSRGNSPALWLYSLTLLAALLPGLGSWADLARQRFFFR